MQKTQKKTVDKLVQQVITLFNESGQTDEIIGYATMYLYAFYSRGESEKRLRPSFKEPFYVDEYEDESEEGGGLCFSGSILILPVEEISEDEEKNK